MNAPTTPPTSLADRLAIAFLERLLGDRSRGIERPLADYLAEVAADLQPRLAEEWLLASRGAAEPSAPRPGEPAGEHIGPFRLLRELGRGGQGVVYLAVDETLQRQVALKVLSATVAATAGAAQLRLQREAEALARLEHPGLARIHATGRDGERTWIAMRYVAGGTVQQEIAARLREPDARPPTAARLRADLRTIARAADALAAAHRAGVLHRDIKPANLLLDGPEQPVLTDFGLAHADASPTITSPGEVFGTLCYLAPERLAGAVADERADVHALGAVLFELLTLERPFQAATTASELQAIATAEPRDVRERNPAVPANVAVVVATALAKDPRRRYQTAAAFAADLQRVLANQPIAARPPTPWERFWLWTQRDRRLAASLLALIACLATGLSTTTWQWLVARAALTDVHRLADLKAARDLQAAAAGLWPARPELVAPMERWLDAVADLLAREPEHTRQLAALPAVGTDPTADWQREQLVDLAAARADLTRRHAEIERRRRTAAGLPDASLVVPARAWQEAIERVRHHKHYGGLVLRPQLGLVPLGPDRSSGLEEFAHLPSGSLPERDAEGRLQQLPDAGIVLVLVPGGRALLGAEPAPPTDGRAANLDASADTGCGPSYTIELQPFFLGKYELTQAQWLAHTGANPSIYFPGGPRPEVRDGRHPVESISWSDADRVLRELDLALPTEAQWEWAYRAGSHAAFPTGDDPRTVAGHDNVADATALARNEGKWPAVGWLDDGHLVHAPVGSFHANAFGLHDLGGNLREWCADSWEDYPDCPPRPGDGLRLGNHVRYRVVRGGSFQSPPDDLRAANRGGNEQQAAGPIAGARAARRIDP